MTIFYCGRKHLGVANSLDISESVLSKWKPTYQTNSGKEELSKDEKIKALRKQKENSFTVWFKKKLREYDCPQPGYQPMPFFFFVSFTNAKTAKDATQNIFIGDFTR